MDIAEARFVELLALAVEAEPEVMRSVRSAAVHFFVGAEKC